VIHLIMPRLQTAWQFSSRDVHLQRVVCDGWDASRPEEERLEGDRVIVVLRGHFAFRDRASAAVISPAAALFLRSGHGFQVRHSDGQGDVSLSVRGAIATDLVTASDQTVRPVEASSYLRLHKLANAIRIGGAGADPLAAEEALCAALAPPEPTRRGHSRQDRAVAEAIQHAIAADYEQRLPLTDLAKRAVASTFHCCRVFRRVTGQTIHQHLLETRLRHALAWLLDSRLPLAEVASLSGFANQGHMGNAFRRRFGVSPGIARSSGGEGVLAGPDGDATRRQPRRD
jgi:AraC-like DNA-binding protein